jgi:hypothetical protein
MSAMSRKAWGDLRRHLGKSLLVAGTLALAMASFAIVAVPGLLTRQLAALGRLPNVAAFEPAVEYSTVAASASTGSSQDAVLWGVGLGRQAVDVVDITGGRLPAGAEMLAGQGNASTGFSVPVGGHVSIRTAAGRVTPVQVSGTGRSLATSPSANGTTSAVFYGTVPAVRALAGVSGYSYLAFRLYDNSPAAQTAAIAAVQRYLTAPPCAGPCASIPGALCATSSPGRDTAHAALMALRARRRGRSG